MNETEKLYKCIYKNAQMGMGATATILAMYTSGSLAGDLAEENKEYRNILVEARNALGGRCSSCCLTEMEKLKTVCGIKMKLMKNDSDSAIAEMLINGCTVGVIDTVKCKNKLSVADNAAVALADRLINFQNGIVERMKSFL